MFSSFRARLIATVITLIAVTAGGVALVSFVLVRSALRTQLIEDSVARAEFNIIVLASTDQLPQDADREVFEEAGLVDRFLLRGSDGVYVEFPGDSFASSLSLTAADGLLSPELRTIVAGGEFGYEFLDVDDSAALVVGGRRPVGGPDFYFFFSADEVASTLTTLSRTLVAAGLGVVILGALAAGLIARRVLRPVAVAGRAAGVMAEGDLSIRLPAESSDELGRLAKAFNTMAASLEAQIAELVAAQDRERRFVADVSHELRTPLTALVNEAAMLETRLGELSEADQHLGRLFVADVARLRTMVEDLLEVSRLEAAPSPPDLSDIDVRQFLAAVIADRHPEASLDWQGDVGRVRTDRRSLERVVGNLLDNARRYAPDAEVVVRARVADGVLRVDVIDTGPGCSPEELPKLFDRFYKTDSSRQRGSGSGLGLSIARQHAERLGGWLTARSNAPAGLVFELSMPVTESLRGSDGGENPGLQPEGESSTTRRTP